MALRPTVLPAFGVFAAAARHQNFAHAAEELHLTASAVSHHVRKLEATLGVSLFQRHARGVTLTVAGRALADAATAVLADLDAVAGSLRTNDRSIRVVRITTLHSLAYCWLIARLPRFTAAHPNIRLHLETSIALTRFDDDGPDIGIRHGAGHWPGLTAYYLMGEDLFPVASPRLAGALAATTAQDVAALPLVADQSYQGWRDWFRAADVRGVRLPTMHTFSDSTDALQAAIHGMGAALSRTHIAAPYLQSGELMRLPGPAIEGRFAYYAVHPTHKKPTTAAFAFIRWLQSEAASETGPAPAQLKPKPRARS